MKYKNRKLLRYLTINPNRDELPSTTIFNFLKKHNIIIVNKSEKNCPESSKLLYSIRKYNTRGFISVCVSKDHLIKGKVNFGGVTQNLVTRNLNEFLELILSVVTGKK